jgi:anaerobic ribonucleoside-triphosphate reductase
MNEKGEHMEMAVEEKIAVNLEAKYGSGLGFERIRRITGYLVGTLDRFNDAKRAEERDRVKHGL